jgi:hypothetical protein
MSNARNLARLIVDSGGDVDVSSLGNVPPSNDASALTTGTLPVGRLPSSGVDASSLTTGTLGVDRAYSGAIIAVSAVRSATRTSMPLANSYTGFSGTFTKKRSDTIIIASATVFGANFSSGNCGVGLFIDGTWDHGAGYQYDGAWPTSQTTVISATGRWTGISSGTHTMGFGWQHANGDTGRPFVYLNPHSSDDPRNQQMKSSIIVYEVMP